MHPIYVSFIINFITLLLKIMGFIGTNSASLLADILNDVGDCIGLGLIILGMFISSRRSSIAYPFGMSRALYVFGLISISIIGGFLFSTSIVNSINSFVNPKPINAGIKTVTLVLLALIVNGFNLLLALSTREEENSPANVSALVDGFADFLGSTIAFTSIATMSHVIDSIGSIIISIIVLVSSTAVSYRYYSILIGRAPPKEEMLKIINAVLSVPGVHDVNELKAVMITENEYLIMLEVEVGEDSDVEDLEMLSKQIEAQIKSIVPNAKHIAIEFVSRRKEPPTYRKIIEEIKRLED